MPAASPTASEPAPLLVVDDGKTERLAIIIPLQKAGWQVASVASARAALLAMARTPFEVLLVDQHLPDCLGSDLIALMVREWQPPPRAILLSADRSARTRAAAHRAGACAVLTKPETTERLLSLLAEHGPVAGNAPATPLLAEAQAQDFLIGFKIGQERAQWVTRWEREVASQLAQLQELYTLGSAAAHPSIKPGLHRLRGSAAVVGAWRLGRRISTLENDSDRAGAPANLAALRQIAADTSVALWARAKFLPLQNLSEQTPAEG